jgi:hypothetical protein
MEIEPTSFIVVAVVIVAAIGAIYGMKTRKGSGINNHPGPDTGDPVKDPKSDDEWPLPESERADSTLLDQHGKE